MRDVLEFLKQSLIEVMIIVIAVIVALGVCFYLGSFGKSNLGAYNSYARKVTLSGTPTAPTTLETTTTVDFYVGPDVDHIDLNVGVTSTAALNLLIMPAFSDDPNCTSSTDPTVYWYDQTISGISGTTVTLTASTTYSFANAANGIKQFNFGFDNLSADCMRLIFSTNNTAGHPSLWSQAILKSN
jgi:hypothetical protein